MTSHKTGICIRRWGRLLRFCFCCDLGSNGSEFLQSGSHRGSLDCGWNVDRHETDAPKHENRCRVVFTTLFLADRLSKPKSMFWPPVGFPCAANDPTTVTEPEEAELPSLPAKKLVLAFRKA